MTGPTDVRSSRGWPTIDQLRRPDQAVDQLVEDRAEADHPGGGRALLAGVAEGAGHDGRDGLVEVGVGVDDDGVLAAHLGHHPLDVALAGLVDGGVLDDRQADRRRAGEGHERHLGPGHQLGADLLAHAGQEGQRPRRHARLQQDLHQAVGDPRRLLGRLEQHGVAGHQRRRHHPAGDGQREVPGGDDDAHPPRLVAVGVASPPAPGGSARRPRGAAPPGRSTRRSRWPRPRRRRPP